MQSSLVLAVLIVVVVATALGSSDLSCIDCQGDECNKNVSLYHYTDTWGSGGINKTRVIFKSLRQPNVTGDDAFFGNGTYFTAMNPNNKIEDLLYNNYGNRSLANAYKFEFYFNCSFKRGDPMLCLSKEAEDYKDGPRDVWLYDIEVNIDLYNCKMGTRPQQSRGRSTGTVCSVCSGATSLVFQSSFLVAASLVLTGLGAVPWN